MFSNRDVVGWTDPTEWQHVFNNIFSGDDARIQHGLDVINIWKCRYTGRMPVAIEATIQIVSCRTTISEHQSDYNKRQCMATAISQFIGLLTERVLKGQMHSVPMRQRGEQFGIPEWMTCLRHEIAHGLLPTFSLLEKGVHFALQWLKINHWDKHLEWIQSKSDDTVEKTIDAPVLEPLLNYIFANSKKTIGSKPPPISDPALLVKTMVLHNLISIPTYVTCNMRHHNKVAFCNSVMKQFERILELLQDSNHLETLLTEIHHETKYPYMPKAAVDELVNLISDINKGSSSNPFAIVPSPTEMDISYDEHDRYTSRTTNCNDHTPASSWSLCDFDLSECCLGLMPGQKKESLWRDLQGDRFLEDDVRMSCKTVQLDINPQHWDFDLL